MEIYIYAISHPITNDIRYIGKSVNIKKRLIGHISKSKKRNDHFHNWIKSILKEGLKPNIEVIKYTDDLNWMQDEKNAIKEYREKGYNLLNIAEGGNEPYCSKEQRAINGKNTAIFIHSDEKRKRFWQLKQQLGIEFRTMYKNGNSKRADEMRDKLATRGIYFNIKNDGH